VGVSFLLDGVDDLISFAIEGVVVAEMMGFQHCVDVVVEATPIRP